jgi:hypothetical protein
MHLSTPPEREGEGEGERKRERERERERETIVGLKSAATSVRASESASKKVIKGLHDQQ